MDPIYIISLTLALILAFFLVSTVWIAVTLFIVGLLGITIFTDFDAIKILANILWGSTAQSSLFALPLFVLMGEIIFRSRMSANLFSGLNPLLHKLPGRLLHVTVVASAMFAAVSGSSAATCATVGKIVLPEMDARDYNRKMVYAILGGSGTLGFLIPPSMVMIVYGITANVSIGQLFIAGIIPGIIIAVVFMLYIIVRAMLNPNLAPADDTTYSTKDYFRAIPMVLPVFLLIGAVLGSIYLGFATPTEAAAVGVVGAFIFAYFNKALQWNVYKEAMMGSIKTGCMIMFIIASASFISVAVGYLGIPRMLTQAIAEMGLSPYMLLVILSIMYIILGCLLDGFSMIVMSIPIALPLITFAGFDPLWFGIYLVIMIQISQITPPIGFNLFVINGITDENIFKIAQAVIPVFILMLLVVVLISVYPDIVLVLPRMMW